MTAATYDITIEQGATYRRTFVWKSSDGELVDLTGYTARMQVRKSKAATTVLVEATTTNGYITLGDAAGTIVVEIPASVTADLDFRSGVWDLELEDGDGIVTRLLEGAADLSHEVTR